MELPKEFDDRHWWIVVTIAGAVIAAASAPVQFVPGFLIGLALLLFGVGQWRDHPVRTAIAHGGVVTSHPWSPSAFGLILSAAGVALFAFGIYRLL